MIDHESVITTIRHQATQSSQATRVNKPLSVVAGSDLTHNNNTPSGLGVIDTEGRTVGSAF